MTFADLTTFEAFRLFVIVALAIKVVIMIGLLVGNRRALLLLRALSTQVETASRSDTQRALALAALSTASADLEARTAEIADIIKKNAEGHAAQIAADLEARVARIAAAVKVDVDAREKDHIARHLAVTEQLKRMMAAIAAAAPGASIAPILVKLDERPMPVTITEKTPAEPRT